MHKVGRAAGGASVKCCAQTMRRDARDEAIGRAEQNARATQHHTQHHTEQHPDAAQHQQRVRGRRDGAGGTAGGPHGRSRSAERREVRRHARAPRTCARARAAQDAKAKERNVAHGDNYGRLLTYTHKGAGGEQIIDGRYADDPGDDLTTRLGAPGGHGTGGWHARTTRAGA